MLFVAQLPASSKKCPKEAFSSNLEFAITLATFVQFLRLKPL